MKTKKNKGSALYIAMITGVIIFFSSMTSLTLSYSESKYTNEQANRLQAKYVAEAGSSRAVQYISMTYLENNKLDFTDIDDELDNVVIYKQEPFVANGSKIGEYTVTCRILSSSEISTTEDTAGNSTDSVRFILLESVGTINSVGFNTGTSAPLNKITMSTVYEISSQSAQVFDYGYFINNWGWWYANNIICWGNARTNGSFDMGPYNPTIYGKPRFEESNGIDLIGYIDDNGDGQLNNQDGGIYAWDTITGKPSANSNADLYSGNKGTNQSIDIPQVPMPNLNDLSVYETKAKERGSIKIGGVTICDGVWGDNESKQNLYLEGTYENPIVIDGTIVVRGDLIIRGYVTGQAAIFSGRNIYISQRLLYRNPVTEKQPSNNSEDSRENWRTTNAAADLVGLFAKENIVFSDYSDYWWRQYVYNWINHELNQSKEDAGLDQIPNTGDEGEGDGVWTVNYDPDGNPIPGSGEDIDGDGVFDDTTKLSDLELASGSFYTDHPQWGGNIPQGVTKFADITYWNDTTNTPGVGRGSKNLPQVNGFLYTNHFLGGYITNKDGYNYKKDNVSIEANNDDIQIFGSVISRTESLIYSSDSMVFYHDDRLSADGGKSFNFVMPRIWNDLRPVSVEFK